MLFGEELDGQQADPQRGVFAAVSELELDPSLWGAPDAGPAGLQILPCGGEGQRRAFDFQLIGLELIHREGVPGEAVGLFGEAVPALGLLQPLLSAESLFGGEHGQALFQLTLELGEAALELMGLLAVLGEDFDALESDHRQGEGQCACFFVRDTACEADGGTPGAEPCHEQDQGCRRASTIQRYGNVFHNTSCELRAPSGVGFSIC